MQKQRSMTTRIVILPVLAIMALFVTANKVAEHNKVMRGVDRAEAVVESVGECRSRLSRIEGADLNGCGV